MALPLLPKLFGRELDENVPVIAMFGGWPDDHSIWKGVIDSFGSEYHLISIPMPDMERLNGLRKTWGYKWPEIVEMIETFLNSHLGPKRQFNIVMHDWGVVAGGLYAEKNASRIQRIVCLDVGNRLGRDLRRELNVRTKTQVGMQWIVPYQLYFFMVFWVGNRISGRLAQLMLTLGLKYLFPLVGPMKSGFDFAAQSPRPMSEVKWFHCYPYFVTWYYQILRGKLNFHGRFQNKIPTLFIYGKNKAAMFHSEEYKQVLKDSKIHQVKGYECSHWVMHEKSEQLHQDMHDFLSQKSTTSSKL